MRGRASPAKLAAGRPRPRASVDRVRDRDRRVREIVGGGQGTAPRRRSREGRDSRNSTQDRDRRDQPDRRQPARNGRVTYSPAPTSRDRPLPKPWRGARSQAWNSIGPCGMVNPSLGARCRCFICGTDAAAGRGSRDAQRRLATRRSTVGGVELGYAARRVHPVVRRRLLAQRLGSAFR